jgi:hypothetical protein
MKFTLTYDGERPRDLAQLAKLIVDIFTGEVEDRDPDEGKGMSAAAPQSERRRARGAHGTGKAKGSRTEGSRKTLESSPAVLTGVDFFDLLVGGKNRQGASLK